MTVFGERASSEGGKVKMRPFVKAVIQPDRCLHKKRKSGHAEGLQGGTHTEDLTGTQEGCGVI